VNGTRNFSYIRRTTVDLTALECVAGPANMQSQPSTKPSIATQSASNVFSLSAKSERRNFLSGALPRKDQGVENKATDLA
jgi:hypothetical protein